jgi:hypothetical protein
MKFFITQGSQKMNIHQSASYLDFADAIGSPAPYRHASRGDRLDEARVVLVITKESWKE